MNPFTEPPAVQTPDPNTAPTFSMSSLSTTTILSTPEPATSAPMPIPTAPTPITRMQTGWRMVLVALVTVVVTAVVAATLSPAVTQARVVAYPQPSVTITFNGGSTVRVGDDVNFSVQVNAGTDLSYQWDFGDGSSTSTGAAVTHTYQSNGQYTVQLLASDPIGQHASASYQVDVLPQPPHACFSATADPSSPTYVTFDAGCSTGTQLQYYWDGFGDGSSDTTGSNQWAQHTYSKLGTYQVTLRVVDVAGQSNSVTQSVQVQVPPPTASFTFSYSGYYCVSFDASNSKGYSLTYNWDFGDGNTSNGSWSSDYHCFPDGSSYTVTLQVVDQFGRSATYSQVVTPQY